MIVFFYRIVSSYRIISSVFYILVIYTFISCNRYRPTNILFIMDDQHRGDCIGALGADWLQTPNLDKLASEGVLFRKAYASVPSCLPARTAILTGKSPWAHGVLGYYDPLESYEYELPKMFTNAGYRTHAVGKNHFYPMRNTHGYESVLLEEGWHSVIEGQPKCDYQLWFEKVAPELDMNATGLHYTDHRGGRYFLHADSLHPTYWTAQRAINFLRNYKEERPWFLKVSFQRPHPPFDAPKNWHDHYVNKDIPMPKVGKWAGDKFGHKKGSIEERKNATSGNFPEEEIAKALRSYFAGISYVDEQIGRLIGELKVLDKYDNTFILFTSDHGDMMGDNHMWRKCRPYEGSANIPMILRWPKNGMPSANRGQILSELVELRDVLPTFLDVAGIPKPEEMDGESMLNILHGEPWRTMLDLEHAQIYEPDNAWTCLTDGRYKYIYHTLTGQQQLFDLAADPKELIDLSLDVEHTSLVNDWRQIMVNHLTKRGAPWIVDGDLAIQQTSQKFGVNDPRFTENVE